MTAITIYFFSELGARCVVSLHEETANGRTVQPSMFGTGYWNADKENSLRCLSGAAAAKALLRIVGYKQRGGFSSSKASLGSASTDNITCGIYESISDTSRASGVSSSAVVGNSKEKIGEKKSMKICASAQQKGGVGKTNCVVHLAHDFAERGLKVLVVDLDPQGNASYSLSDYKSNLPASDLFYKDKVTIEANQDITLIYGDPKMLDLEQEPINIVGENLKNNLDSIKYDFDVCLLDTAPTLGVRLTAALYTANYVFTPIEVAAFSMLGVGMMKKTISNMASVNPSLVNLGLIPSRMDRRNPLHVSNYNSLMETNGKEIAPVVIGQRSSFEEALHTKVPVWKIKKTAARKAATEMREFAQFVFESMELK